MNKYEYTDRGFTFKRIDKKSARRAFSNRLPVVFCPCNLRPGGPWHPEIVIDPAREMLTGSSFDSICNSFEFYNCNLSETGKYTAFYIPVKDTPGLFAGDFYEAYDSDFIKFVRV